MCNCLKNVANSGAKMMAHVLNLKSAHIQKIPVKKGKSYTALKLNVTHHDGSTDVMPLEIYHDYCPWCGEKMRKGR